MARVGLSEPNTIVNETAATHQLSFAIPTGSTDLPTPEGFLRWLILRCLRRLENSNLDLSKRNMYLERIAVLQALQGALENPLFRASAMRNMAQMADISDDEESPNYRGSQPTSLGDAQRAHNFFMMLRGQTSGSRHVDSVVDALTRPVKPMEMRVEKKFLMNIWRQLLKSEDDTMDLHRIRCQTQTFGHISTTLNH